MKVSKKNPSMTLYQDFSEQFLKRISSYDYQTWEKEELQKIVRSAFLRFEKQSSSEHGNKYIKLTLPKSQNKEEEAFTLFVLVNADIPFLVDSTLAAFRREGVSLDLVVHLVLLVERDDEGNLLSIFVPQKKEHQPPSFFHPEALICILVKEDISPHKLKTFSQFLQNVYVDVKHAVEDWGSMRAEMEEVSDQLLSEGGSRKRSGLSEIKAFFKWLLENHFTFLGYRSYHFEDRRVILEKSLGVARDTSRCFFDDNADFLSPTCLLNKKPSLFDLLNLTKSSYPSLVHRPVPMDVLRIERLNDAGEIIGEFQFFGLLTSSAYSQSVKDIPLLRSKVLYVLNDVGFSPDSHDGKALMHIIETLPRDFLFQISEGELASISISILNLQEKERVALFLRKDPYGHLVSCLLYVPKDHYNLKFLEKTKQVLAQFFKGELLSWQSLLGDLAYARVNFIYSFSQEAFLSIDEKNLEKEIQKLALTWEDRLKITLIKEKGEKRGRYLYEQYKNVFPILYQERFITEIAIEDIDHLEFIRERIQGKNNKKVLPISVRIQTWIHKPNSSYPAKYHIKVYVFREALALSDILPLFENLGLKVIKESNFHIFWHGHSLWIHDFEIAPPVFFEKKNIFKIKPFLEEAFIEIVTGRYENDSFNKLVSHAGISIHQAYIFRSYARYLKQIQFPYSQDYIAEILCGYPKYVQKLRDIFYFRFDPVMQKSIENRKFVFEKEKKGYKKKLISIQSLDEDKILRCFIDLIEATKRTSFFQKTEDGIQNQVISFKIFPSYLPESPYPRPRCEIFVYGSRVEGVHLRGGVIARGGIRFSDRKEDYRTEILGLFKAQTLKNAVIVPVGAKGGFIAKKLPSITEREAFQKEVIASYVLFIKGLLNITDNLKDGKNISPRDIVKYDEDDPYLVVAADKGTATFSDIANSISQEYNFWLGDAFASGGSHGYDHKKIGITAKGAWISVDRHFWELGFNIEQASFTVIGVGDMSGDVFGNAMLLSDKIRLIAAFDHRHIFLDPTPDPIKSYEERKRIFEMPRSSWADYNPAFLSEGGGIYERSAKEISLSNEVKDMLNLTQSTIEPNTLIQAILKAKSDLLWMGGIGTFVKASQESNMEIGDRQNDVIRISASDLNCRVVGEGANLGFTQKARIEYALNGGRINTDAIDNSAGVDCSDHEVNLKILFQKIIEKKDLTYKERNLLLEKIEKDVEHHVLEDNILQSLTLSVAEKQGISIFDQQIRFIQALESQGKLDRDLDTLPSDKILAERRAHQIGLTRPELSVLLSHSKVYLKESLLRSSFLEEPNLDSLFNSYFPTLLVKDFYKDLKLHPLKKEILALVLSNFIISRTGITFIYEMVERSGFSIPEVMRAILKIFHIFDLEELLKEVKRLHKHLSGQTELQLYIEIIKFLRHTTLWFLNHEANFNNEKFDAYLFSIGIQKLLEILPLCLTTEDKMRIQAQILIFEKEGVELHLAQKFGYLLLLEAGCHILYLTQKLEKPIEIVASLYFQVGERFRLNWLREEAERLSSVTYWDKLVLEGIIDDLYQIQTYLTSSIISSKNWENNQEIINDWEKDRAEKIQHLKKMYEEFKTQGNFNLSMLLLACRHLYQLS